MESAAALQARLVEALRKRLAGAASPESVRLVETHISYVLLAGGYAYKVKKAIRLGFLDFSTLAARRFYCDEELRLNRRHAPALYLDVVAITGTPANLEIGGSGPILDYAVRMAAFSQESLLSNVLERGTLSAAHIDRLAASVAAFHRSVSASAANGPFGAPDDVLRLALDNFSEIGAVLAAAEDRPALDALEAWTRGEHASRRAQFAARREAGFVRECHGDLHLGNIALVDDAPLIFDCIEFNERMRWIDVMSEVAFTEMDLVHRGRPDYAHRFRNAYLEATGDYAGIGVSRFYLVYRAMVRAKVACLRLAQLPAEEAREALRRDFRHLVRIATAYAAPPRPAIVVNHGLAGCGKTTVSQALLEHIGAIRIRTDVERKRLYGLGMLERSHSGIASGLYAAGATRATYHYVASLARDVVAAGSIAIVDATFLERWQREIFRRLAAELGVPFAILDIAAPEQTLRARILQRASAGGDASEAGLAVLEHQMRTQETLADEERGDVVVYDGTRPLRDARDPRTWRMLREKLERGPSVPPGETASAAGGGASARARRRAVAADLAAKIAFLCDPASYAEGTSTVTAVETHMSWVFLTDHRAYKLKKPVRTAHLDLREVSARLSNCVEELRLNRRLASGVYEGLLPLLGDGGERLSFARGNDVADWLVQMRRLPAARMLDRLVREGGAHRDDVDSIVTRLCAFYRRSPPVAIDPPAYRADLAANLAEHCAELCRVDAGLAVQRVERARTGLAGMLSHEAMFDARVREGRIVEGHGDLRPEHICLEDEPQIIDCLEFSRRLRTLDTVDEIGFLALECERLAAPATAEWILAAYREHCGDPAPSMLVHFYQGYRACVRAVLAIRHLAEPDAPDRERWTARASAYVELANAHVDRCG